MSTVGRDELTLRLGLAFTHRPSDSTRHRHLHVVESAITEASLPNPAQGAGSRLRHWVAVAAAILASLFPVGVAVAAQRAVPGDQLYQVKLATESVRSVLDPLLPVRNRIEELETLMEREADPAAIEAAYTAARAAAGPLEDGHPLLGRLRELEERIFADEEVAEPGSETGEAPTPDDPDTVAPPGEDDEDAEIDDLAEEDVADGNEDDRRGDAQPDDEGGEDEGDSHQGALDEDDGGEEDDD